MYSILMGIEMNTIKVRKCSKQHVTIMYTDWSSIHIHIRPLRVRLLWFIL